MRSALASRALALRVFPLALVCTTAVACQNKSVSRDTGDSVTAPPAVRSEAPRPGADCPKGAPPSDATQLKACLDGIEFETVPALGDEQRLMVQPRRHGPLTKIEPVLNSHEYSQDDLKEGRIIARFTSGPGEAGYPKLGIVAGQTTYWWVQIDETGRAGRSFYISEGKGEKLSSTPDQLKVDPHPGKFKQAVARWVWYEDDEKGQGTCGQACCK